MAFLTHSKVMLVLLPCGPHFDQQGLSPHAHPSKKDYGWFIVNQLVCSKCTVCHKNRQIKQFLLYKNLTFSQTSPPPGEGRHGSLTSSTGQRLLFPEVHPRFCRNTEAGLATELRAGSGSIRKSFHRKWLWWQGCGGARGGRVPQ